MSIRAILTAAAIAGALAGCSDRGPGAPAPTAARDAEATTAGPTVEFRAGKLAGEVVATSADGSLVATVDRAAGTLVVYASTGERVRELALLAPEDERGTARYAVSNLGLVAEADNHDLRLTRIRTGEVLWTIELDYTLWGDLAFSPDSRLIALLFQGQVNLMDVDTRAEVHVIGADPVHPERLTGELTLPRAVYFSPDGKRLAIRCGTDAEGPANHTLFVSLDLATIAVRLHGHTDGFAAAALLADEIVTVDDAGMVRTWGYDGALRSTLALPDAGTLGIAADGGALALGQAAGRVLIWRDDRLAITPVAAPEGGWPVYVAPPDRTGVWVVDDDGTVAHREPTAASAPLPRHVLAQGEAAGWAAVWRLASGDANGAEAALAPIARRDPVLAGALALARATGRGGPRYSITPADAPATLALAETYVAAGYVERGYTVYRAWLVEHAAHARPAPEAGPGLALGLALHATLDGLAAVEAEVELDRLLYAAFPDDDKVGTLYRRLKDSKPSR